MQFTLVYQGPLKSNGNPAHKHEIRVSLSEQLQTLWNDPALAEVREKADRPAGEMDETGLSGQVCERNGLRFLPLCSAENDLRVGLNIRWIRPLGAKLLQHGDLDNRPKTLFDALQVPPEGQAQKLEPHDETLDCLLDDDSRIEKLHIETARLLKHEDNKDYAALVIDVELLLGPQTNIVWSSLLPGLR